MKCRNVRCSEGVTESIRDKPDLGEFVLLHGLTHLAIEAIELDPIQRNYAEDALVVLSDMFEVSATIVGVQEPYLTKRTKRSDAAILNRVMIAFEDISDMQMPFTPSTLVSDQDRQARVNTLVVAARCITYREVAMAGNPIVDLYNTF